MPTVDGAVREELRFVEIDLELIVAVDGGQARRARIGRAQRFERDLTVNMVNRAEQHGDRENARRHACHLEAENTVCECKRLRRRGAEDGGEKNSVTRTNNPSRRWERIVCRVFQGLLSSVATSSSRAARREHQLSPLPPELNASVYVIHRRGESFSSFFLQGRRALPACVHVVRKEKREEHTHTHTEEKQEKATE